MSIQAPPSMFAAGKSIGRTASFAGMIMSGLALMILFVLPTSGGRAAVLDWSMTLLALGVAAAGAAPGSIDARIYNALIARPGGIGRGLLSCLLLVGIGFFAGVGLSVGIVSAMAHHFQRFGNAAQLNHLEHVMMTVNFAGLASSFGLASQILLLRDAFPTARERSAAVALIIVTALIICQIGAFFA